jgi:hypothetical protein
MTTFLCRALDGTGQGLHRVPEKSTWQRSRCQCTVYQDLSAESHTRQRICRVYSGLCQVPEALDKAVVSGSAQYFTSIFKYICNKLHVFGPNKFRFIDFLIIFKVLTTYCPKQHVLN